MWQSARLFPSVPGKASHFLGKPTGILQKFLLAISAWPNCFSSRISATHPEADAPNKGVYHLSLQWINTWTKCPTKERAITFHWWYFHRVSLQGFRRGESILAGRACLGLCSSNPAAPKITSVWGSKEGKESRDPIGDSWSPHAQWAQREHWSPGMTSRSQTQPLASARHKAQGLHSHFPVLLCGVWNPLSSNFNRRSRSLVIYLPQKIPPEKFYAILKKTVLQLHLQWKMLCIRTGFEIERFIIIL